MAANANKTANEKLMTEMETVYLHKESREDDTLYVSLNGRTYLIPKNQPVEVPKPVAEIIRSSQKAQAAADAFVEEAQKVMRDSERNPMGV